ncbi:MAG TPA: lipopolysaccharide biosynthesis protein [Planctomycetota bacterium]|jgi:O-antigen/teichoic acid export membrane protein
MNQEVRARLLKGVSANTLLPIVTAVIQLCSVPVFLEYWGVTLYGEWLVLSAVPSYLTICDLGFCRGSANEMTIQVAAGDKARALETFQSTWVMISVVSCALGVLSILLVMILPIAQWFHGDSLTAHDIAVVLIVLTLYVLLDQQAHLLLAGFRCEMRYALGSVLFNAIRLAEFVTLCLAVICGAGPVAVAWTLLLSRFAGIVLLRLALKSYSAWLVYGWRHFRMRVLREMMVPALGFFCIPVGHALSLQGMLMLIGALCGPAAVVVFSTARTLTRWGFQMTNMISISFSPEISRAWGIRDLQLTRKLHNRCVFAAVGLTSLVLAGLAVFGEWAMALWTHKHVEFDGPLFNALLLSVLVSSLWYSSAVVPMATNRHQKLAVFFLVTTLLSLALARFLVPAWNVSGAAYALLAGDLAMAVYVLYTSARQLNEERWVKQQGLNATAARVAMNGLNP